MVSRYAKRPAYDPSWPTPANDNFPTDIYEFPKPARNPKVRPPVAPAPRAPFRVPGPLKRIPLPFNPFRYAPLFEIPLNTPFPEAGIDPYGWRKRPSFGGTTTPVCRASPPTLPPDYVNTYYATAQAGVGPGPGVCGLGGQAAPGGGWDLRLDHPGIPPNGLVVNFGPYQEYIIMWTQYEPFMHMPPSSWRFRVAAVFSNVYQNGDIIYPGVRFIPAPFTFPTGMPGTPDDPNIVRITPSPPLTPIITPITPGDIIEEMVNTPPEPKAFGVGVGEGVEVTLTPEPATGRQPPPPNTKETKLKVRQIAAITYQVLDQISEGAEIVDAFFDALPDDVKKRWEQKGRTFLDTTGQYGLDGADWKLRALWHNWDKVDFSTAVTNLLKNHIEDAIIGRLQKRLPVNTGVVADPGNKAISQAVAAFFEELGL